MVGLKRREGKGRGWVRKREKREETRGNVIVKHTQGHTQGHTSQ